METRVALLIVYNHRYDKNISKIEEILKTRFSYRFHVIPFYDGRDEISGDIVSVVGHSWYFQGYICQAYQYIRLKYGKDYFTHYFVIADDMLLNPIINENNLWHEMGISEDNDFFPEFIELQSLKFPWRIHNALDYKIDLPGVEILKEIPTIEDAQKRFIRHGISVDDIPLTSIFNSNFPVKLALNYIIMNKHWRYLFKRRKLCYPLVGGYSDIFLITNSSVERFIHYCGAFASTGLFVEIAIPTALVLCSDKIKTFDSIKMKSGAIWTDDQSKQLNKYNFSLKRLINEYPSNVLFIHPIKLSKWMF